MGQQLDFKEMEENKDYAKYKELYEEAIKQSTEADSDESARWRSAREK